MGNTITTKSLLVAATTVTLLVSLCLTGYMLRPRAVKAASLMEPGIVFAPSVVFRGQHVRACANNLFGDGSVRWAFEFRSHNDASKVLASSGFLIIGPEKGACLDADVSDLMKVAGGDVNGDAVGIIAVLRAEKGTLNGGTRSFPIASFQTCPADPNAILIGMSCSSMLPAVQGEGLLLPAVQR